MQSTIDTSTDGHVHTWRCRHAVGAMEEYVLAAIERGLKRIIFLEHLEVGIRYIEQTWLTEHDFAEYYAEGKMLQEKYRGRIDVGVGVEAGYNPEHADELAGFLARYSWDRIGISYHFIKIGDRHFNVVSRKDHNIQAFSAYGVDRLFVEYYQGLVRAVRELPADVVCHLDAALRYHPDGGFIDSHWLLVRKLFEVMRAKGVALEVNTSGYRLRGEPFPVPAIIAEAIRQQVPLAAGSDAHAPGDVGRYFDRLAADIDRFATPA